ncbi:MAG: VWA domain-containing protein [Bifidobacteriaceae bacterium]|jgi:Mg-chelatase subunit ChlD|nr:VWA domain-containing protein [Bifidobacteriaceae bacterium]
MSFIYPWLLLALPLAGAAILAALAARRRRLAARRGLPGGQAGTRLANTTSFVDLPGFREIARQHYVACALGLSAALLASLGSVVLAARPAKSEVVRLEQRTRDVVLCLDISGSMYPVDAEIISQFREIVERFDGERVAMSWFNSSSVTLFPLTDDYTYVDDTLRPIERQFEAVAEAITLDDWMRVPGEMWPDDSGTLLGEGSSLPGDGLASCLMLFDDSEADRPRSIIFATDNVVEGSPIFELSEATAMAAEADVHVYALCPSYSDIDVFSGEEEQFREASDELRAEIRRAGGSFFRTSDYRSVSEIVESILAGEAAEIEGPPRRVIHDRPGWGIGLLATGLAGIFIWGGWRGRPSWLAWSRRVTMVVLTGVAIWNPALGTEKVTQQAVDADVIVLVDTSPSLAAEDWAGDKPRLDGVKADLAAIATHHAGAHIAIITFDSAARLVMPLSSDPGAALAAAETLTPVAYWRASGSSIDAGLDLASDFLSRQARENPERARLIYYLGDGEQTRDEPAESFGELAELVDGGAVLGYGTAAGGKMLEHQESVLGEPLAPAEYIRGPDGEFGRSKIDEEALRRIASDLGVPYSHRSATDPVESALWSGELPERTLEEETSGSRPLGFLAAIVIFGLLVWELALALPRASLAKAANDFGAFRRTQAFRHRVGPWAPGQGGQR